MGDEKERQEEEREVKKRERERSFFCYATRDKLDAENFFLSPSLTVCVTLRFSSGEKVREKERRLQSFLLSSAHRVLSSIHSMSSVCKSVSLCVSLSLIN